MWGEEKSEEVRKKLEETHKAADALVRSIDPDGTGDRVEMLRALSGMVMDRLLSACADASERYWPGPVARYAKMTIYEQGDVLFCEVKLAEDALPDPVAYRSRLISVAATALDLAEAIDAQLKEAGDEE